GHVARVIHRRAVEVGDERGLALVQLAVGLGDRDEPVGDGLGLVGRDVDLGEQLWHGGFPFQRRRPTRPRSSASRDCGSSMVSRTYLAGSIRRLEASKTARSSMYSSISMSRDGR